LGAARGQSQELAFEEVPHFLAQKKLLYRGRYQLFNASLLDAHPLALHCGLLRKLRLALACHWLHLDHTARDMELAESLNVAPSQL
jgi:hypothetical protein